MFLPPSWTENPPRVSHRLPLFRPRIETVSERSSAQYNIRTRALILPHAPFSVTRQLMEATFSSSQIDATAIVIFAANHSRDRVSSYSFCPIDAARLDLVPFPIKQSGCRSSQMLAQMKLEHSWQMVYSVLRRSWMACSEEAFPPCYVVVVGSDWEHRLLPGLNELLGKLENPLLVVASNLSKIKTTQGEGKARVAKLDKKLLPQILFRRLQEEDWHERIQNYEEEEKEKQFASLDRRKCRKRSGYSALTLLMHVLATHFPAVEGALAHYQIRQRVEASEKDEGEGEGKGKGKCKSGGPKARLLSSYAGIRFDESLFAVAARIPRALLTDNHTLLGRLAKILPLRGYPRLGAFVTIREKGKCIGSMGMWAHEAHKRRGCLFDIIAEVTKHAFADVRFPNPTGKPQVVARDSREWDHKETDETGEEWDDPPEGRGERRLTEKESRNYTFEVSLLLPSFHVPSEDLSIRYNPLVHGVVLRVAGEAAITFLRTSPPLPDVGQRHAQAKTLTLEEKCQTVGVRRDEIDKRSMKLLRGFLQRVKVDLSDLEMLGMHKAVRVELFEMFHFWGP